MIISMEVKDLYEAPVAKTLELCNEGLICVSRGTTTTTSMSWETEEWEED